MTNQTSIQYITSLLSDPASINDGDQSSISLFRQTFPYFMPVRYLMSVDVHRKTPYAPHMLSGIIPYMGDWMLFCDFLKDCSKPAANIPTRPIATPQPAAKPVEQSKPLSEEIKQPEPAPVPATKTLEEELGTLAPIIGVVAEKSEPIILKAAAAAPVVSEEKHKTQQKPVDEQTVDPDVTPEEVYLEAVTAENEIEEQDPPLETGQAASDKPVVAKYPVEEDGNKEEELPEEVTPVGTEAVREAVGDEVKLTPEEIKDAKVAAETAVAETTEAQHLPEVVVSGEKSVPIPVAVHIPAEELPGQKPPVSDARLFMDMIIDQEEGKPVEEKSVYAEPVTGVSAEEPENIAATFEVPAEPEPLAEVPAEQIAIAKEETESDTAPAEKTEEAVAALPVQEETKVNAEEIAEAVEIIPESADGEDNTATPEQKKDYDPLIFPVYTRDYFLQQGERISDEIPLEINELKIEGEYEDKSLMVVMSFSEWLLHFKNSSERQKEESRDQKALKTMWQKEKLAAAIEEENEEIPENVFAMAVSSISKEDGLISETLAEIYIKQGKHDKAIEMYRKLSLKNPQKSAYFAVKIDEALKDKEL